jgi:phosphate acyltransferase
MSSRYRIALDVMGGDHGPEVVIPAALNSLKARDELAIVLVGDEGIIRAALGDAANEFADRLVIQHASQRVEMDDLAFPCPAQQERFLHAGGHQPGQGWQGRRLCQRRQHRARSWPPRASSSRPLPVSTGPPSSPNCIPSKGQTWMLDLGANVDCTAEHLFQFALMGSALAGAVDDIEHPRSACSISARRKSRATTRSSRPRGSLAESPELHRLRGRRRYLQG